MFHGKKYIHFGMFHAMTHNILGLIVSRETLSCVHNPNLGNVSRETFLLYQIIDQKINCCKNKHDTTHTYFNKSPIGGFTIINSN